MTGLLGGGHAIYWDAAAGRARNLDFFVAVPGLGAPPREPDVLQLAVPFGEELVHYAVGPATCAVPGVAAGLDALWRAHGRLPWPRLVEPALRHRARRRAAAPGARRLPGDARARLHDARGRAALRARRVAAPGWRHGRPAGARTARSKRSPPRAPASSTRARSPRRCSRSSDERGGLITREDLARYEARWAEPVEVAVPRRPRAHARRALGGAAGARPSPPPRRPQRRPSGSSS